MKLDVVVPTYNRSGLLRRTLASLLNASVPAGLEVVLIVADNNSKDDTEQVVRELAAEASIPIVYVKETKQGSSHARNAGINAGSGTLIGFIDDDEEIDKNWYEVVAREFTDEETQYIGGPYFGNWSAPPPAWLPPGYHAVIGVIDPKPRSPFGKDCKAMLMGGNAVIRRSVFERIGLYSTRFGRTDKGLLSDEDTEFFRRLWNANLRGMYVPDLIIYHYIPGDRLTRRYHRRWCYWRGLSQGYSDREAKEPVPYFLGIPRYKIGKAFRGLASLPVHFLSRNGKGQAFADELASWDLFGFILGRHFIRMDRYHKNQ